MRRSLMAVAAATALAGAAVLAQAPAFATEAAAPRLIQPVQFHGAVPFRGAGRQHGSHGWDRRQWRDWRQQQSEARIAEAARRKAWRIGQERGQRPAWRRSMREQHGHGPAFGYGHHRGW